MLWFRRLFEVNIGFSEVEKMFLQGSAVTQTVLGGLLIDLVTDFLQWLCRPEIIKIG